MSVNDQSSGHHTKGINAMRDHDDLPYIVIERRSAGLGPFVWGTLIGAAAALLLAPRSGAETQEDIRRSVRRARSAAEDRIDTARTTVERTRERIEDQIGSVRGKVDDVKERLESRAEQAMDIVDDGRRAARDVRDEVERRIANARDHDDATAAPDAIAASGRRPDTAATDGLDGLTPEPESRFAEPSDPV
jgi:gas vesicle protein